MNRSLLKEISENLRANVPKKKVPDFLQGMTTMPNELPLSVTPARSSWEVVESPRRLKKTFDFAGADHRNRFVMEMLEEQDKMHHHSRMTIDENEIHVEIYTKDLNSITEVDHHLSRLADLIYADTRI